MASLWGRLLIKGHWRVLATGLGGVVLGVTLSALLLQSPPQVADVFAPDEPAEEYPRRPRSWLKNTNIIPSFPCEDATTPVERLICSSADLARLDYDMSDIFFAIRGTVGGDDELQVQRAWLHERDDKCLYNEGLPGPEITDADHIICLSDIYKTRLTELSRKYVDGDDAPLRDYYADGPNNRPIFKDEPDLRLFELPRKVDFRAVNGIGFLISERQEVGQDEGDAKVILEIFSSESSQPLETVEFGSRYYDYFGEDDLSEDIVIINEWGGRGSCCYIVHAFQTKPKFKRLLRHNNKLFDPDASIVGKDTIELYDQSDTYDDTSKSRDKLVYTPTQFDLRNERWGTFYPPSGVEW
jgi:uncharacterized protein